MLITHYQFFSLLLKEDLNIPNSGIFLTTHFPATAQNKYYKNYLKKFNQKIINQKKLKRFIFLENK